MKVACKTHWCSEFVEGQPDLWYEKDPKTGKHTTYIDESDLICKQAAALYDPQGTNAIEVKPCSLLYYEDDADFMRQVEQAKGGWEEAGFTPLGRACLNRYKEATTPREGEPTLVSADVSADVKFEIAQEMRLTASEYARWLTGQPF